MANNNNGGAHSQMDDLIKMSEMEFQMSQILGPDWRELTREGQKRSGTFTTLGDLNEVITTSRHTKPSILNKLLGGLEKIIPGGKTGERGEDVYAVEGAFPWAGIYGTETPGEGTQHYKAIGRGKNYREALEQAKNISRSKALWQPESRMTEAPVEGGEMETVKSRHPIENILGALFKGTIGKGHEFMKGPSIKTVLPGYEPTYKREYRGEKAQPVYGDYLRDEEGNRIEDVPTRYGDLLNILAVMGAGKMAKNVLSGR